MVLLGWITPSRFLAPFPSLLLLLLLLPPLSTAKFWNAPSSVSVPVAWTGHEPYDFNLSDYPIKVVLYRLNSGPSFLCGFICLDGDQCIFGLLIFQPPRDMKNSNPELIWFASLEPMNKDTAQILLTKEGDFIILGDNGKKIWSTNTAGKSIVGLNLTEVRNLVLYDRNDTIIWQSFDHPRDKIVPGQMLRPGMERTATSSALDETALVYTFTTDDQIGFVATVRALYSPQIYYRTNNVSKMKSDNGQVGALYKNGTFAEFDFHPISLVQFIQLGDDGHLKRYVHDEHSWNVMDQIGNCDYPLVCGSYSICSYDSYSKRDTED